MKICHSHSCQLTQAAGREKYLQKEENRRNQSTVLLLIMILKYKALFMAYRLCAFNILIDH